MSEEAKPRSLTYKQELFCREYVIDGNATRAAESAGYSKNTAYSIGSELLKKPEIQAFIDDLNEERVSALNITHEQILTELLAIATSNVQDFVRENEIIDIASLPRRFTAAVQSIKTTTKIIDDVAVTTTELKLHPKMEALKTLADYAGLLQAKKIDITTNGKDIASTVIVPGEEIE